jgi:DNA-binding response OmpR family regulator
MFIPKLLIAESSLGTRDWIKRVLSGKNITFFETANLAEADLTLKVQPITAAIIEVELGAAPDSGTNPGLMFAQELRKKDDTFPIIFVHAHILPETRKLLDAMVLPRQQFLRWHLMREHFVPVAQSLLRLGTPIVS